MLSLEYLAAQFQEAAIIQPFNIIEGTIIDLYETSISSLHYFCCNLWYFNYFSLLGRLRYDISLRLIDSFVYFSCHFVRKLKEIHNILEMNRLRRTRLYEIGIIERDFRLLSGLPGSSSRPAYI